MLKRNGLFWLYNPPKCDKYAVNCISYTIYRNFSRYISLYPHSLKWVHASSQNVKGSELDFFLVKVLYNTFNTKSFSAFFSSPSANKVKTREAHRRVMLINHPHRGGLNSSLGLNLLIWYNVASLNCPSITDIQLLGHNIIVFSNSPQAYVHHVNRFHHQAS